jgi:LAO/AO transport system kinase
LKPLLNKVLKHDRRAIAQLISIAENDPYSRIKILSSLYKRTGRAYVIGITGPPGAGKSTLIAQLARHYRREGYSVGIVAIDPTSQVTGGALLGDRIRMTELAADPQIFIRSMATRGQVGGIARATEDVVKILDAASINYIIVETVGAGQSDVDIKTIANTTVVVTAPGLGDEIQALKAGIMEIGDVFVVNKGDKENADLSMEEINSIISISDFSSGWRPRVLKTTALSGEGVMDLAEAIKEHSKQARATGEEGKLNRLKLRREVLDATKRYFEDILLEELALTKEFERLVSSVEGRRIDPYSAAFKTVGLLNTRKLVKRLSAV